jgi:dTDP-glucose pyrophosphorylase
VDDRAASAWAVVLAGGEGMRLRSVTRAIMGDDRPKQYVPLISGDSLLRQTLMRAAGLSPRERTVVVSQQHHAGWLAAELSAHRGVTLLLQPENRDTAAGVLLPVYWIAARDPEATVVVYPSDHFVLEGAAFLAHVAEVVAFVDRQRDGIILLGARATEPDTEYGWIEPGDAVGATASGPICRVARFREKPTPQAAAMCLAREWLWNTFVMVAKASTLVSVADVLLPRASPSSHGRDAVSWHAARGVGARAGLRVPPSPQLLRDGPAGRPAVSLGVGAAAADLVRSRDAAAAVEAPPGPGDRSALDARAPAGAAAAQRAGEGMGTCHEARSIAVRSASEIGRAVRRGGMQHRLRRRSGQDLPAVRQLRLLSDLDLAGSGRAGERDIAAEIRRRQR